MTITMRFFRILPVVFLFAVASLMPLSAEEASQEGSATQKEEEPKPGNSPIEGLFPRFRGRAVVLDISASIVEQNQTITWNESHRKATIPGRPVGIKIVGSNVVVAAQFTPYIRHRGLQKFLVAQGQIWMEVPDKGIQYFTAMQTIPMEFGEPIYFFPLGSITEGDAARIEVMLTLHPYEEKKE